MQGQPQSTIFLAGYETGPGLTRGPINLRMWYSSSLCQGNPVAHPPKAEKLVTILLRADPMCLSVPLFSHELISVALRDVGEDEHVIVVAVVLELSQGQLKQA